MVMLLGNSVFMKGNEMFDRISTHGAIRFCGIFTICGILAAFSSVGTLLMACGPEAPCDEGYICCPDCGCCMSLDAME